MNPFQEKQLIYKKYTVGKFIEQNWPYFYDVLIVSSFWSFLGILFAKNIPVLGPVLQMLMYIVMYAPLPLIVLLFFDLPNKIALFGIDNEGNIYLRHFGQTVRLRRAQFTGYTIANYKNSNKAGFIVLKHLSGNLVTLPVVFFGTKNLEELDRQIQKLCHLEKITEVFDADAHYKQDAIKKRYSKYEKYTETTNNYRYRLGVEMIDMTPEKTHKLPPLVAGIFLSLISVLLFTLLAAVSK